MAKYKDIDAIIEQMNGSTAETWGKGLGRSWWSHSVMLKDNIVQLMKDAPEADVVEVVRCKDCMHWHYTGKGLTNDIIGRCSKDDFFFERRPITAATDFCSYGERRKDAD